MPYDAIFLDLDGTLVDTIPAWVAACKHAFAAHNVPFTDDANNALTRGKMLHTYLHEQGHNAVTVQQMCELRDHASHTHLRQNIRWHTGAQEFLTALQTRKRAIVTSAWRYSIDIMDEVLGLYRLVPLIIDADTVQPHFKPLPHGLLLAAQKLRVDPTRCAYIGDQPTDMEAARAAGMTGILLRTSHTSADATGDFEATTLKDVLTLL